MCRNKEKIGLYCVVEGGNCHFRGLCSFVYMLGVIYME